jgi:putative DNA methylase
MNYERNCELKKNCELCIENYELKKKKLIEVALPLEAINAESAREKSIRHGHPSTLHLWWARRPLAAARAVIWSSLVDDPSSHPEEFPTEESQNAERERLFKILSELVKWENSNNQDILNAAKAEILKSTDGNPPALLDPFAGGGSIPLEAQRLGLEAHASDLNPVAVMINKAMIEIPPKFAGQPPVNPVSRAKIGGNDNSVWQGASGLAEDVRYYGEWMKKKAFERIGHLYPKVKDEHGQEHTVIAWIWARTVKCPNPACGCEMPLASSFELSKKKGKEAYIQPIIEGKAIRYEVRYGKDAPAPTKTTRGANFKCIRCGESATNEYVRKEAVSGHLDATLMAVIAEGSAGRLFVSPTEYDKDTALDIKPIWKPDHIVPSPCHDVDRLPMYGMPTWGDAFTDRQLTALSTFSELVCEAQEKVLADGGTSEYAKGLAVYLAFAVDRLADYSSKFATWSGEFIAHTFGRQAIQMVWDYAECNPFSDSTGNWGGAINWIALSIGQFPQVASKGYARQFDAQVDSGLRNIIVSTDPPYYDNISYADVADYFYVWMRHSLKEICPEFFKTLLTPKTEELVASPYRFEGGFAQAKNFFENGLLNVFKQIHVYTQPETPVTVYYAFKQSEVDENNSTASSGWETMLSAIIQAGFIITGTWPMRTERTVGIKGQTNMLASSIVLVCRKRPADASSTTRRDFINALKRELKPALQKLQASNIAPVDLAQSAIGPGMGVYSRFSKVLEADGTPMSVRAALQIINQELDLYFTEQDGELDRDSRFCVDLYTQYAFNDMKFGEADVLARAKNTSVEKLASRGILYAQKGIVRLITREEMSQGNRKEKVVSNEKSETAQFTNSYSQFPCIWQLCQQLTLAMEKDGITGAATIVADILTSEPELAKSLAYRLFQIAERKGWAADAYAYNSLVIAWSDVQTKAADIQTQKNNVKQTEFEETKD